MILNANALNIPLADNSVQCVITSPPYYGLRSYLGSDDPLKEQEIGLEQSPEEYVAKLVAVFREVKRVLRDDGTCWVNLGDSYSGSGNGSNDYRDKGSSISKNNDKYKGQRPGIIGGLKPKDLIGIPWRVAFALQADGWWLRSDIIWAKPNPMPESVTDRCTKSHEYLFMLTKSPKYYYDAQAILEPAAYDGRKDTKYKGGPKDMSIGQHERWSNTIDTKYADDDFVSMGGAGTNWVGHSAYHGSDGRELFQRDGDGQPARNKRTVWVINTQPTNYAHFATFPEKLVEPCIKAGTSERGCCPKCGKPWQRVTEKQSSTPQRTGDWKATGENHRNDIDRKGGFYDSESITTGWLPGCECDAGEPVPCIVFDPFAGSGTVERVAIRLRRWSIGTELNYQYIREIATRRTADIQPNIF